MKIRVGIIGAGHMGHTHAKILANDKRVEIAGIADIVPQNAARLAALKSAAVYSNYSTLSSNDPAKAAEQASIRQQACIDVRDELIRSPNYNAMPAACDAAPLDVNLDSFLDSEGMAALRLTVVYDTVPLVPIPGLLQGKLRVTRVAEARVYGDK